MNNLQTFERLIELEKRYRYLYSGVLDADAEERYDIDKNIFPNWWFNSKDYDLKLHLITKYLKDNVPLIELEDNKVIEMHELNTKIENNFNNENV